MSDVLGGQWLRTAYCTLDTPQSRRHWPSDVSASC